MNGQQTDGSRGAAGRSLEGRPLRRRWVKALLGVVVLASGSACQDESSRRSVTPKGQEAQETATTDAKPLAASEAQTQFRQPGSPSASRGVRMKDLPPTETPEGPVTGAPGIRCEKTTHDFGVHWVGGTLTHEFIVRNEGDQELEILSVRLSCGCAVAGRYDKRIPPGGQGKIPVSLNTNKVHGKFSKSIRVNSNDPVTPALRLKISGEVKEYLAIRPRSIHFGHIKDAQTEPTLTATLTNNTDQEVKLTLEPPTTVGPFRAELVEKEAGKLYELRVSAKPPYGLRHNSAKFKITTNIASKHELEVPVSAYVPPRLSIRPEQVILGSLPKSEWIRPIRFTNNGSTPVKVLSAEVDDEQLKVELVEGEAGKAYEVRLTIPVGYAPPEQGRVVTLRTDDAERPEIRVPVKARKTPAGQRRPAEALVGKPAPKVTFNTLDGRTVVVGQESGTVTVLSFYVSWSPVCQRQVRVVAGLHQRTYADNPDVRFVGVSLDELKSAGATSPRAKTEREVVRMFAQAGAKFENALDPQGLGKKEFQVGSVPTLVLLGKDGVVQAVHFGAKKDLASTLGKQIDLLLAGKTRTDFPR